jgi:hypothetical protein
MPVPTQPKFNNLDILGLVTRMDTIAVAQAQELSYPGVDGVERLFLGGRGGFTDVQGLLFGETYALLAAAQATLRAYVYDGGAYALLDDKGVTWSQVVLTDFKPTGRIGTVSAGPSSVQGMLCQPYQARFRHLI